MRTFDPKVPKINAKSVLRAMVKRRDSKRLTTIAKASGIEPAQLKSFRSGGDLPASELQRLTRALLRGQADYHKDTDTLTAKSYSPRTDSN